MSIAFIRNGFNSLKNIFQSSLLSAVLGEVPKDEGLINVRGRIAYVSQQPWVFSGTVRSNILFDKEYVKEKYEKVLKVCALKKVSCFSLYSDLILARALLIFTLMLLL